RPTRTSNMAFYPPNTGGGGGGSVTIGDPVTGGDPNSVLYIDGAGDLAQDAGFLRIDGELFQADVQVEEIPIDYGRVTFTGTGDSGLNVDYVGDTSLLPKSYTIEIIGENVVSSSTGAVTGGPFILGETVTGSTSGTTGEFVFY